MGSGDVHQVLGKTGLELRRDSGERASLGIKI